MANVLFLVHRLPFPPDKGDKVRSHHLLRFLAARHRVFVGTFVDNAEDLRHVDDVRAMCTELCAPRLRRGFAMLASLRALLFREPLTLAFYRHRCMRAWVSDLLRRERIDVIIVFSSSMVPYAQGRGLPLLIDFVDVDSAKWASYAAGRRGLAAWVYDREGRLLLEAEGHAADEALRSYFVTRREADLFRERAPAHAARVETLGNGVDADHFSPDPARPSPFTSGELALVFTGVMDYLPNIDAVIWFERQVLPGLRQVWPGIRLHIVGRRPVAAVRALAGEAVQVTGAVDDVRPYLQHAAVVVAPMRLARGIHNKILEAMAMGRPVVASTLAAASLDAEAGRELLAANQPADYLHAIDDLLRHPGDAARLGRAARDCVRREYDWNRRLAPIGRQVEEAAALRRAA